MLAYSSKMTSAAVNCGNNGKDVGEGCGQQCFLKGTMIRTADDDRKIEDLVQGDLLPTVFGGCVPFIGSGATCSRRVIRPRHGSRR